MFNKQLIILIINIHTYMITTNLNEMPSYSGLHYIMSKRLFQPSTSIELEAKYSQIDINHLLGDELDINNKIPMSIREEIEQEQEFFEEGFLDELERVYKEYED